MLVSNIMQVLKNLFGLNKKIAASEIAFKDSSNNVYTLDNYLNNGEIYSTSEKRVGTWIDGKPLYRRTFSLHIALNAGYTTYAHGIRNIDTMMLDTNHSFMVHQNKTRFIPLPTQVYGCNFGDRVAIELDQTNIIFTADTSWGSYWNNVVTILYTKTTD